jgi:hypothetical protein
VNRCVLHQGTLAVAWLALTAWSIPASAADGIPAGQEITIPALSLRVPKEEMVPFAAFANEDTVTGQPGYMMYAGPPAAALVGVLTHGVIESQKQAREKRNKNSLSDLVLAPYQPSLSRFTNAELMRRALDGLTTHGDKVLIQFSERAGPGWLIECSPEFFMTQDARALVLQNAIVIHSPDAASPATFKNVVEVVGQPRDSVGKDSDNTWMIEGGALLTSASVDLLRESMNLALSDLHGEFAGHSVAYQTVRYPRGGAEKMERAQILRVIRERVVLKTLRGWIMSVPVSAEAAKLPDVTANR